MSTKKEAASTAEKPKAKAAGGAMTDHQKRCVELAKKYFRNYPGEKVLHITSDMQVFLSHNRGLALAHQRTMPQGIVISVDAGGKIVNL